MSTSEQPTPCCAGGDCGGIDRREFLKSAGVGLITFTSAAAGTGAMAGPFFRSTDGVDHFVPAEKRLNPDWLKGLYARGTPRVCRDAELNLVGMPVGGIGAGQVYLCGDGTLSSWKIFNQRYFSGTGENNYLPRMPDKPVAQGFAVVLRAGDTLRALQLNRQDFPDVEFVGEYPLGQVRYGRSDFPVRIELAAYSPFIPLNARDSALPATIMEYTVENSGTSAIEVALLGWLENAICLHTVRNYGVALRRRSRVLNQKDRTLLLHTAEPAAALPGEGRSDIVIADFEGGTYGDWTVEGEAFGTKPAGGTMRTQNPVDGFLGAGLVNSYLESDTPHGRLLSPEFRIERKYISFLIGGGQHPGETCINLLVGGKTVRTATGRNSERLLWETWDVQELAGQPARIEILDRRSGPWGHVNVDQITQSDRKRFGTDQPVEKLDDWGEMVLALSEAAASIEQTQAVLAKLLAFGDELRAEADGGYATPGDPGPMPALATCFVTLPPGRKRTFTFVVGWYFPNRAEGNMYTNWFSGAADVAHYVCDNHARLAQDTRLWHDTYYDSTLPRWLLDRLHYPVANLATGTCLWWKNGRFWAWEGVGCCEGTCAHVWNYAHALARLFPELERSVREMQDLDAAFHETGLVGFRGTRNNAYAADGQAGTVLKCYREHLMAADDSFLRRNWPRIRKVLEFSMQQDADDDGLIENSQHNTFDINFEGPNTFVGSLYLAALRAGEEMARETGDVEFADRLRRVFQSGQRLSVERLWNGEYFVQRVDLKKYPKYQYGDGCLSDHLFGQGWAHLLGLGYIYPQDHVRKALESIWKYNWTPDVGPQNAAHPPQRWFVQPGEAGLFMCTWPKSEHLSEGVLYREEVWTGTEYQVAGHMLWEQMVEPALVIVRAVHDRYDPLKHNPYNEVECGDHYARALASWGAYLALGGYEYHGPRGHLGFAPRLAPEDFRAAFTAAEGWGTFAQRRQEKLHAQIELKWGRLRLTSLSLSVPAGAAQQGLCVRLRDRDIPARGQTDGDRTTVHFEQDVVLNAGDRLEVTVG